MRAGFALIQVNENPPKPGRLSCTSRIGRATNLRPLCRRCMS